MNDPKKDVVPILNKLAEMLSTSGFVAQSNDLKELIDLCESVAEKHNQEFKEKIIKDKYYWAGMGTIADICFNNLEKDLEFESTYRSLAEACARCGLESIYSKQVAAIYGRR